MSENQEEYDEEGYFIGERNAVQTVERGLRFVEEKSPEEIEEMTDREFDAYSDRRRRFVDAQNMVMQDEINKLAYALRTANAENQRLREEMRELVETITRPEKEKEERGPGIEHMVQHDKVEEARLAALEEEENNIDKPTLALLGLGALLVIGLLFISV